MGTPHARILIPSDFSTCSMAALRKGVVLGRQLGFPVDVLHVWQPTPISAGAARSMDAFIPTSAGRRLDQLLSDLESEGYPDTRGRLEVGDPVDTIVRVAKEGGYRLIVMGTHGRRGLDRLLWGSVAEHVVRIAPCPVMTIRAAGREPAAKEDDVVGLHGDLPSL